MADNSLPQAAKEVGIPGLGTANDTLKSAVKGDFEALGGGGNLGFSQRPGVSSEGF